MLISVDRRPGKHIMTEYYKNTRDNKMYGVDHIMGVLIGTSLTARDVWEKMEFFYPDMYADKHGDENFYSTHHKKYMENRNTGATCLCRYTGCPGPKKPKVDTVNCLCGQELTYTGWNKPCPHGVIDGHCCCCWKCRQNDSIRKLAESGLTDCHGGVWFYK